MRGLIPRFAVAVVVQFVFTDFAAEGVAVDSQGYRRARLIAVGTIQNPFDKALFKFAYRFVEKNAAFHHLIDEPFQLILHARRSM
jgi:hypothetical protein